MNKKYIDFVPIVKIKASPKTGSATQVAVSSELRVIKKQKVGGARVVQKTIAEKKTKVAFDAKNLASNDLSSAKDEVLSVAEKEIKAPVQNKKSDSKKGVQDEKKSEMKIPRVNFINQEKVVKRPLSKNVYTTKAEKTDGKSEGKKEPVVIIENENKSKVGTVIAIIIAIILGAVAGTVVFFLIPK